MQAFENRLLDVLESVGRASAGIRARMATSMDSPVSTSAFTVTPSEENCSDSSSATGLHIVVVKHRGFFGIAGDEDGYVHLFFGTSRA